MKIIMVSSMVWIVPCKLISAQNIDYVVFEKEEDILLDSVGSIKTDYIWVPLPKVISHKM